MKIFKTRSELASYNHTMKTLVRVGFVPTMGALHDGHISLIRAAKKTNEHVICSVFVNPTQFNDPNDLERYPRTLEKDIEILERSDCDIVFVPEVAEVYPTNASLNSLEINLHGLDERMEGKFRPNHFKGVVLVINNLFNIVQPTSAYFGEKDFQQLQIIRHFASTYFPNIEIYGCPIARESDGLAMSSRNMRLSESERKIAPFIYKTLRESKALKEKLMPDEVTHYVYSVFKKQPELILEYYEIVDSESLQKISNWSDSRSPVACIAAFLGNVRLIDNILLN